ncbi:MAG: VIT1/CCC1 transporter family protein [Egibacteraceae bacterium]
MTAQRRYRRRLAAERDAAAVYRALASRRSGEERESLLALARAEERHARHWAELLGDTAAQTPHRLSWRARLLGWLARRVSSLLVLAVVQRAELDMTYDTDAEAGAHMAADERIHARVVAGLARRRRARVSGLLRASVFGVTDGLVSNASLILGMAGAGAQRPIVLLAGLAGLLAGALSMAAGEYVSVRSQRELLSEGAASNIDPRMLAAARSGDLRRLEDLLRHTGMPNEEAVPLAAALLRGSRGEGSEEGHGQGQPTDVVGSAAGAALSSFTAFALGAFVPVVPYLLTASDTALFAAMLLTAAALFAAGVMVGVLTGGPLVKRGIRQLLIGASAATVTYGLGRLLGVTVS